MAEEKKVAEEAAPQAPKKSTKKLLFLIIGLVGLVLCIGVPAIFFLTAPAATVEELPADAATTETEIEDHGKLEGLHDEYELEEGEERLGAIVPFDTFIINLTGGRYVRLQVQVEFETLDIPKKFYAKLIPIRDALVTLFSQRTAEELLSEKGKDKLRIDIKETVNGVLRKQEVKNVYFTQFVIQ